jgi:hypothetical protein
MPEIADQRLGHPSLTCGNVGDSPSPGNNNNAVSGEPVSEAKFPANREKNTYATLLEALNRHRGKGKQKVTVEHVHVHSGGRAVVDVVGASGGGDDSKSEEQPHAKQIAHALEPARNPAPKDRSRLETLLRVGRRVHSSPSTILTRPFISRSKAANSRRSAMARQCSDSCSGVSKLAPRPDEMARDHLLSSTDQTHEQPKPISPYSRDRYRMLSQIRDRVSGEPVEQRWLRTYAETLRGYHRYPETKFLHADATDNGRTERRHILVEMIEDIGKEADKWDEEEPLGADDEFTVSYGLSVDDRNRMLAVIRSVPKRQLASAAKMSTRTIPTTPAAANEMPDAQLRRIFTEASLLADEQRKLRDSDELMLQWLGQQVNQSGLKTMAELLEYDAATLRRWSQEGVGFRESCASGLVNK